MTIGSSPPRLEAGDKATGRAQYADDIALPGMLHAALLTSPHAHARIIGYRVDAARAIPGVKAILTGADFNGPRAGGIIKDESMVARGKVRYVGEPVAAVAATDPEIASAGRRGDRGRVRAAAGGAFDRRGARTRRADPARGIRRATSRPSRAAATATSCSRAP